MFLYKYLVLLTTCSCSSFIFIKLNSSHLSVKKILLLIGWNILFPMVFQMLGGYDSILVKLIFMILISVSLLVIDHKSIPLSILSVTLAYYAEYVSVVIAGICIYYIGYRENNLITTIVTNIVQILLCWLITKTKFFKKLNVYLYDKDHIGVGILITSYLLIFSLFITQRKSINITFGIILLLLCPLFLVGLILWIRSIVNRYFKRKIADRADAFTQQEIKEKDERIEQLETEIATLAKQVHRDNHLLSSLDRSVRTLAETESAAEREQLADEFRTLYRERNDLIAKEQQERKLLPSTGVALIDGALSEMYVKATAHGIHFDLMVGEPIHYLVNNIISQTDLQTLLCDHIKDAIIAVDAAKGESGKILVSIEKHEGLFEITIRDNGVDFTPETLAKLGKERVTTHAEEGGSGIGFMTTFETLEKTKGSLIITEHESKTPFSKSVAFVFDGLHQFIISSYRRDELKEKLSRDDILYL